jgi:hypothetical protein
MLNLMESSDISHKPFAEICEMCKNYQGVETKQERMFGTLTIEA